MFECWKKEDLHLVAVGEYDGVDWLFTRYIVATKEGDAYRNVRPGAKEIIPEPATYRVENGEAEKGDLGAFLAFYGNYFDHLSANEYLDKSDVRKYLSKMDNLTMTEEDKKWFGIKKAEKAKVKALNLLK